MEAEKDKEATDKMNPVDSIYLTRKQHGDVIDLINAYTKEYCLHVTSGTKARNAIATFLLKALPGATEKLKASPLMMKTAS